MVTAAIISPSPVTCEGLMQVASQICWVYDGKCDFTRAGARQCRGYGCKDAAEETVRRVKLDEGN